jgi:dynein heavy chain
MVRAETQQIELLKTEAEQELQAAIPALESAIKAVESLSKDDVTELKNVKNPNPGTELALKCVLTYLGVQKYEWSAAQKMMTDIQFLHKLRTYDRDNIPSQILAKVKLILNDKNEFNVEKITNSSKAAGGMAKWCISIYRYA